jgi:hypothetical protein
MAIAAIPGTTLKEAVRIVESGQQLPINALGLEDLKNQRFKKFDKHQNNIVHIAESVQGIGANLASGNAYIRAEQRKALQGHKASLVLEAEKLNMTRQGWAAGNPTGDRCVERADRKTQIQDKAVVAVLLAAIHRQIKAVNIAIGLVENAQFAHGERSSWSNFAERHPWKAWAIRGAATIGMYEVARNLFRTGVIAALPTVAGTFCTYAGAFCANQACHVAATAAKSSWFGW